jgi:MFS family permease
MLTKVWPALHGRNLRYYLLGQVPSLAGTFLQNTAQSWLIYTISHSAYWVGVNAFLFYLPTMTLAPIGGIVIDRWDIRKILIFTQCLAMMLAFILGFIVLWHTPPLWVVNLFAFLLGMINAIDNPARQSLVTEIVDKRHLKSALAMNSAFYNIAVATGPAFAALLIPNIGIGWTFIANGFSFWGILVVLWFVIRPEHLSKKCPDHPLVAIVEGFRWITSHHVARRLIFISGATILLGYSFRTILPIVAVEVFYDGPRVYGLLAAATAFGAFAGALTNSLVSKHLATGMTLACSSALIGVSLVTFSLTHDLTWGLGELFFSGAGLMFSYPIITAELQEHARGNNMIGRVMGWNSGAMFGSLMLGGFLNGVLAQHFGSQATIKMSGVGAFALALLIFFERRKLGASSCAN